MSGGLVWGSSDSWWGHSYWGANDLRPTGQLSANGHDNASILALGAAIGAAMVFGLAPAHSVAQPLLQEAQYAVPDRTKDTFQPAAQIFRQVITVEQKLNRPACIAIPPQDAFQPAALIFAGTAHTPVQPFVIRTATRAPEQIDLTQMFPLVFGLAPEHSVPQPLLQEAQYALPDRTQSSFQPAALTFSGAALTPAQPYAYRPTQFNAAPQDPFQPQALIFRQWNPPASPQGGQVIENLDEGPEVQPYGPQIFSGTAHFVVVAPTPPPLRPTGTVPPQEVNQAQTAPQIFSGTPHMSPPIRQTPAGRKTKERYVARYKGEDHEFASLAALEDFLQWVKESEAPRPKRLRAPVQITLTPEFAGEIESSITIPRRLFSMPAPVAMAQIRLIENSLASIMAAKLKRDAEDDDDEETLLWLM